MNHKFMQMKNRNPFQTKISDSVFILFINSFNFVILFYIPEHLDYFLIYALLSQNNIIECVSRWVNDRIDFFIFDDFIPYEQPPNSKPVHRALARLYYIFFNTKFYGESCLHIISIFGCCFTCTPFYSFPKIQFYT